MSKLVSLYDIFFLEVWNPVLLEVKYSFERFLKGMIIVKILGGNMTVCDTHEQL